MPAVAKPPADKPKVKRRKRVRRKPRKLKLKGWLKTPEDWARFNEWVKVNALPRKLPEPELIVRPSKPLARLKKRAKLLARPKQYSTAAPQCVFRPILKRMLNAQTTARTKRLALPVYRDSPGCRRPRVKRSALRYEATPRIEFLSLPKERDEPECGQLGVSRGALRRISTETDAKLARPKWTREMENEDNRSRKKRKGAEELSAWMEFLAIPNYRILKEQHSEAAEKWKKQIVAEMDERGKQAFEEQLKKLEKLQKRQNKKKKRVPSQKSKSTIGENTEEDKEGTSESDKKSVQKSKKGEGSEEDEKAKKKRKKLKNAWRYIDMTCKGQPVEISKAALQYEASPLVLNLAIPKKYKNPCITKPLVTEAAMSATASPRVVELSKPKYTSDPVERKPPWERDEYDRPIIPKPPYGKVLPKTKPYEPRPCKGEQEEQNNAGGYGVQEENETEEEEEDEDEGDLATNGETRRVAKRRMKAVNPLVFADTVDPLFDRATAAKQVKVRKHAMKDGTLKSPNTDSKGQKQEQTDGQEEPKQEPEEPAEE